MECEKCKSKKIRVIDVIETPIIDKCIKDNILTVFKIRCLECKHEFKEEYID